MGELNTTIGTALEARVHAPVLHAGAVPHLSRAVLERWEGRSTESIVLALSSPHGAHPDVLCRHVSWLRRALAAETGA